MPDPSKLQVFQEQQVRIARTCGTCEFGSFTQPRACWGECTLGTYNHAKHGQRLQPAHVTFTCPRWKEKPNLYLERELGEYASLLEKA